MVMLHRRQNSQIRSVGHDLAEVVGFRLHYDTLLTHFAASSLSNHDDFFNFHTFCNWVSVLGLI